VSGNGGSPILEVKDLRVSYGAIDALRGVFIHLHQFDPRIGPAVLLAMAAAFFLIALFDFRRT